MNWRISHRADPRALPLADRHYNRQKPGSPQFVPPGSCLVLLLPDTGALWVTSYPKAEYVKHAWAGAWMCSCFRREAGPLASELITEAVAISRFHYGEPPEQGMVTFVDPRVVPGFFRRTAAGAELSWGYSYQKAGFQHVGWTKGGLLALRLAPEDMPVPLAPVGATIPMFDRGIAPASNL